MISVVIVGDHTAHLILTMHADDQAIFQMLDHSGRGYVLQSMQP